MNYRNVYRALSVKNAYIVMAEIYEGCQINDFRSFEDILKRLKMNKATLRRITNRLSRSGVINSVKDENNPDKRKRVYVIADKELIEKLINLTQYIAS